MATITKVATSVTEGNSYGVGSVHWTGISNMTACGALYATASGAAAGWLYSPIATDFDFALANTDVITKIEVKITGSQDGTSYLDYCSLLYNGTPAPYHCFQADAVDPLDGTEHTLVFQPTSSGDPDLWGAIWTPAMVNDATFGVTFDGYHNANDTVSIDCVQITITYTPGGVQPATLCDGLGCDDNLSMDMALKALIGKIDSLLLDCKGLKVIGSLKKCSDLTDLTECGTKYTLEQALKSALTNDGCNGWGLRVWILPNRGNN